MDMYRRNSFKDWWNDIGFIYAIVIAFMAVIFLLRHIEHVPTAPPERAISNPVERAERH